MSEIDFEQRVWTIPTLEILQSIPRFLHSDYVYTTTETAPISGFEPAKDRLDAALDTTHWRMHDDLRGRIHAACRMSRTFGQGSG